MNAIGYYVSFLLFINASSVYGCMSGGRSSMRGRPGRISNREPLIYKQYIPNRSELSISASGPTTGKIERDSPKFEELFENNNIDIVFKDDEGTGADRMMSHVSLHFIVFIVIA